MEENDPQCVVQHHGFLVQGEHSRITEDAYKSAVARELGRETYEVARALGVQLETDVVQKLFEAVRSVPSFEPSMLHDRLTGHNLEVDTICGQVARMGQANGVDVSHLLTVSRELEKINQEISAQRHSGLQQCLRPMDAANAASDLSVSW